MQVTLHDEIVMMQVTLQDKRIVMQVTLHYNIIVMQVTLHHEKQKFPCVKVIYVDENFQVVISNPQIRNMQWYAD